MAGVGIGFFYSLVIRTRVTDPKFWDSAWLEGSRVVTLATGHDPMISAHGALTQCLLDCAAGPGRP